MRERLRNLMWDERVRFVLVGGFNTAVGFLAFVLVGLAIGAFDPGWPPAATSVVVLLTSHLLAAVTAFFLYRRVVFRVRGNLVRDFLRFESVYLIPLAVNTFLLPIIVLWGMNQFVAQAIILILMTLVSYVGHKYFSFRRPPAATTDPNSR